MPYNDIIFYNYGPAASINYPVFFDEPEDLIWNPEVEICEQEQFRDFTGVDSLSAFLCSILVFAGVQWLEHWLGRPLFNFPGLVPYRKDTGEEDESTSKAVEKGVELEETAGDEHTSDSKGYSAGVKDVESSEDTTPEPTIEEAVPASEISESEHEA